MSHTPYGYRIENGKAVIDIKAAEQIETYIARIFRSDSLDTAAKKLALTPPMA